MRIPPPMALAVLLSALVLHAPTGTRDAAAAPEAVPVVLRTLELSQVSGALLGIDGSHVTLKDAGGAARRFPIGEVVSLDLPVSEPRRSSAARFRVVLTGGAELMGQIAGGKEDVLRVRSTALGDVELLLDHIRTLESMPAHDDPCHDLAARHPRPESGDMAYDAGGDEYRGAALEVDDQGVILETSGGRERSVAWKSLRVLHLENDTLPTPKGIRCEVELQDGSRLATSAPPVLEGKTLTFALRALPKKTFRVDLDSVRHVRWRGAGFVYASDLPFKSTHTHKYKTSEKLALPDIRTRWFGARVDRRSDGCPLRMDGRTYRHGFGVNSASTVTIQLDGAYKSFQTWIGLDDRAKADRPEDGEGNVDVRILGDGKVLFEAKGITEAQKARHVGPLDVSDVKSLVLEVGFGKGDYALDRADWGEPILIKK